MSVYVNLKAGAPLFFEAQRVVNGPRAATLWKFGDEVELPEYLGGHRGRVVFRGTLDYTMPAGSMDTAAGLTGHRMIGVRYTVGSKHPTGGITRHVLVPQTELKRPACDACGKR